MINHQKLLATRAARYSALCAASKPLPFVPVTNMLQASKKRQGCFFSSGVIESLALVLMGYEHRKAICLEEGGGFLGLVRHLGSGDERDAVVMVNKE